MSSYFSIFCKTNACHPLRQILIVKYDFSDAYRHIAHSAQAAHQTISIVDNRAHMALHLTFGGSPNPPTWCTMAEVVTDLANEINHCPQWNHTTVHRVSAGRQCKTKDMFLQP